MTGYALQRTSSWADMPRSLQILILSYFSTEELQVVARLYPRLQGLIGPILLERFFSQPTNDQIHAMVFNMAFNEDTTLRHMLCIHDIVPNSVSQGRRIGSGGTNTVYAVTEHSGMVIKIAGGRPGNSPEFNALVRMEAIGLRTVLRDIRVVGGIEMLVMQRIQETIDSKSIIGYQRTLKLYSDPRDNSLQPNMMLASRLKARTIMYLLDSWDRMFLNNISFGDFQFLLDAEGDVFLNDPTSHKAGTDDGTRLIIQTIINTFEFRYCQGMQGMGWRGFKQFKQQLQIQRLQAFGRARSQAGYSGKFMPPTFCILDQGFDLFSDPPLCTLFITQAPEVIAGFTRIRTGNVLYPYGYYPVGYMPIIYDKKDRFSIYEVGAKKPWD